MCLGSWAGGIYLGFAQFVFDAEHEVFAVYASVSSAIFVANLSSDFA